MKTRQATWLNPLQLSESLWLELSKTLSISPVMPPHPKLYAAFCAYCHAMETQQLCGGNDTDLTELKNNVKSLESALSKMSKVLGSMEQAHFLDEHYYLANQDDMLLMNMRLDPSQLDHDSGFAVVVERLTNAVRDFKEDSLTNPGKGRKPDTTYTMAIVSLADFFEAAFPERPLTHNKGTVFANFATFWLAIVNDKADPQAHIKTALAKSNAHKN